MGDPVNYEFAWESLADTKSNPGPDVVREILSGLHIEKSWCEINLLVTKQGQLQTFPAAFIEMRNVCAYTGRHLSPPTGPISSTLPARKCLISLDTSFNSQTTNQAW